jgi:hypothetical protein
MTLDVCSVTLRADSLPLVRSSPLCSNVETMKVVVVHCCLKRSASRDLHSFAPSENDLVTLRVQLADSSWSSPQGSKFSVDLSAEPKNLGFHRPAPLRHRSSREDARRDHHTRALVAAIIEGSALPVTWGLALRYRSPFAKTSTSLLSSALITPRKRGATH